MSSTVENHESPPRKIKDFSHHDPRIMAWLVALRRLNTMKLHGIMKLCFPNSTQEGYKLNLSKF